MTVTEAQAETAARAGAGEESRPVLLTVDDDPSVSAYAVSSARRARG